MNNYKFTGKEEDGTGLYYFGARYYDNSIGRFTSTDPANSGHSYNYTPSNPTNFTDPTGLYYSYEFAGITRMELNPVAEWHMGIYGPGGSMDFNYWGGVRRDIIESNPFGYLAQTDPLFAHIYSNTMWNISNVSEGNMQIDALSGGDEMETGKNYYTKVRSLTSDEGGQLAFAIFMIMIRGGEEGKKSLEALKGKAYVAFVTPEDNIGT